MVEITADVGIEYRVRSRTPPSRPLKYLIRLLNWGLSRKPSRAKTTQHIVNDITLNTIDQP